MDTVIEARDLAKRYDDLEAVRGVSFSVQPGEIFGFLGPNGAGKSTTINILCTLALPTGGGASVAGYDVVSAPREVRRRIIELGRPHVSRSPDFYSLAGVHDLFLHRHEDPFDVASVLWRALESRPALGVEALALAAAAALIPAARARGLWGIAGLGAALLAAALLPVATVAAIPLVVAVWATCGVLALR